MKKKLVLQQKFELKKFGNFNWNIQYLEVLESESDQYKVGDRLGEFDFPDDTKFDVQTKVWQP